MIYICIPSHNEERTVGVLLWKIRQVLTAFPRDYELLVLDDASDDRTGEVLAPYARILPLTVLRHSERKGYSASLDELLREAVRRSEYPRRDVVLTLQADFTEEPDDIPALLKRIESGADIVTTRARIAPERAPRKLRWMRAVMSRMVRRLDWPENVTDVLSGLRAYRVIGLRKALEERNGARLLDWHDAWAANAALLRAVKPYVRRIDEVEIELRPDRRQRDSRFDAWTTARQLLRLTFGRRSAVAVPPRAGGAAIVPASELAAATREPARAPEPRRRGRGDRGDRGDATRPASTTTRRAARAGSTLAEAPARRGSRAERPEGERGERPARERGRGAAGSGAERSEQGEPRERRPRGARAERPARERSREEAPEPLEAATEGAAAPRSRPRRRKRGSGAGAAAAAETGAPAAALTEAEPLPGLPQQDAAGAAEAPEGVLAAEGAVEGAPGEARKRRRRPPRRRSRGSRAEGAAPEAGAAESGDLAEATALDAGATGDDVADGAGSEGGDQLELVPGAAGEGTLAGTRPRRRSRRGGRGRSRGRRAAAEAGVPADLGDRVDRVDDPGLAAGEPVAGEVVGQRPQPAGPRAAPAETSSPARPVVEWGSVPAPWERGVGAGGAGGVDAAGERAESARAAPPSPPAALPPVGGDAGETDR